MFILNVKYPNVAIFGGGGGGVGECYFGGIRGVVSGHHFLTFSFSWSLFFSGQSLLSEFYGNVAMK